MKGKLSARLAENRQLLAELLHVEENFDLIARSFLIADREA